MLRFMPHCADKDCSIVKHCCAESRIILFAQLQQQRIQPPHKGGRIIKLPAFRQ